MDTASANSIQGDWSLGVQQARDYWDRHSDRPQVAGQGFLHALGYPLGGALGRDAYKRIQERVAQDPRFATVRDLVDVFLEHTAECVLPIEDFLREGAEELEFIRRDAWDGIAGARGWDKFWRFVTAALALLGEVLLSLAAGAVPGFLHGYRTAPPALVAAPGRPTRRRRHSRARKSQE